MVKDEKVGESPAAVLFNRQELVTRLTGFLSLVSSGTFSALCLILIASNRVALWEPACTTFLLLFLQWQSLGMTIAKHGIEQVVFAAVSQDETMCFNTNKYMTFRVVPLALSFSIVAGFIFSAPVAAAIFFSIVLDTQAQLMMSDLNARKKYLITSVANLFNYPLFFILILGLSIFAKIDRTAILLAFLATSFFRWLWLVKKVSKAPQVKELLSGIGIPMGIKEVLNYLLFRMDQLLLAIPLVKDQLLSGNQAFVHQYLYMAKFPELLSGVLVIAGTVLYPKLYLTYPLHWPKLFAVSKKAIWYPAGSVITLAIGLVSYRFFWSGEHLTWQFVIPFYVHSLCIFFVNMITYSMIRQGYLMALVRNLSISVLLGALVCSCLLSSQLNWLSWVVPGQLVLFSGLMFLLSWGKKRELYA